MWSAAACCCTWWMSPAARAATGEDFEKINEELASSAPSWPPARKSCWATSATWLTQEQMESSSYIEGKGLTFVPISAATSQGVRELPGLVYNRLKDIPPVQGLRPSTRARTRAPWPTTCLYRRAARGPRVTIDAPWLEQSSQAPTSRTTRACSTSRDSSDTGILTELVAKGVQEKDTIIIGEYEFDYLY